MNWVIIGLFVIGIALYLLYHILRFSSNVLKVILTEIAQNLSAFELWSRRFNPLIIRKWRAKHQKWINRMAEVEKENIRLDESYQNEIKNLIWEYEDKLTTWKEEIRSRYSTAILNWEKICHETDDNVRLQNANEKQRVLEINKKRKDEYDCELAHAQKIRDSVTKHLKNGIERKDQQTISEFFQFSILFLFLPYSFPKDIRVNYRKENKGLYIVCRLPSDSDLISVTDIRFIKKTQSLSFKECSKKEFADNYSNALRQIAMVIIHQCYSCDNNLLIDSLYFQGWLDYLDPSTGKISEPVIMTLQVSRETYASIDFKQVEPTECFNKRLKGICVTQAKEIVPVQPIIVFDKNDPRFVDGYDVISHVEAETNLATIDWQDFENLIRDLFEKRYCSNGQDVKITQSSRDKGVDAVLFDPDPIKGGKIIIQAKRYTNVVPVSAVRDLYGTVHSEGANRGILVTTSHFGNDSYEFAKNKPLTLLSGNELLGLLLQIDVKAKIDIIEAKRLQIEDR